MKAPEASAEHRGPVLDFGPLYVVDDNGETVLCQQTLDRVSTYEREQEKMAGNDFESGKSEPK